MQSFDIAALMSASGIKSGTKFPKKVEIGQYFYREDLQILFVGLFDERLADGTEVSNDSGGPGYIYIYEHAGRAVWSASESFRSGNLDVFIDEAGVDRWDNQEAGFSEDLPVNTMLEVSHLIPKRIRGQVTLRCTGEIDSERYNEIVDINLSCEDLSTTGTAQVRMKSLYGSKLVETTIVSQNGNDFIIAEPLGWSIFPIGNSDPRNALNLNGVSNGESWGGAVIPIGDSQTEFTFLGAPPSLSPGDPISVEVYAPAVIHATVDIDNTRNVELTDIVVEGSLTITGCRNVQLNNQLFCNQVLTVINSPICVFEQVSVKSVNIINCDSVVTNNFIVEDGILRLQNSLMTLRGVGNIVHGRIELNRSDLILMEDWKMVPGFTEGSNVNAITINRWSSVEYVPIGSESISDPIHMDSSYSEYYVVDSTTSNGLLIMPSAGA